MGNPTCADDVMLLATEFLNMQLMLNICFMFNGRSRAKINTSKSEVACNKENGIPFFYGFKQLPITKLLTHLGLKRPLQNPSADIIEKISTARRCLYAHLSAGIHGTNGVSPAVSRRVIQMKITPVLLSGLEAVILTSNERRQIDVFFNQCIRNLQALRKGTSNSAIHLLFGLLPIEAELDRRILQLFGNVTRLEEDNPLRNVAKRQLASPKDSKGWFTMALEVAAKYDLDAVAIQSLYLSMNNREWKKVIGDAIFYFWQQHLIDVARASSSLKYLDVNRVQVCRPHHIWPLKGDSRLRVAAAYRAKMVAGSYILQSNRARYNNNEVDPTCPLCEDGVEDLPHFITTCTALREIRDILLTRLIEMNEVFATKDSEQLTVEILNCGPCLKASRCKTKTNHSKYKTMVNNPCECVKVGNLASILCLKLHNKRNDLLAEKTAKEKAQRKTKKKTKDQEASNRCLKCRRSVTDDCKAISCDSCSGWQHIACGKILSDKSYETIMQYKISLDWKCLKCAPTKSK